MWKLVIDSDGQLREDMLVKETLEFREIMKKRIVTDRSYCFSI
jgi:hypothetical protein